MYIKKSIDLLEKITLRENLKNREKKMKDDVKFIVSFFTHTLPIFVGLLVLLPFKFIALLYSKYSYNRYMTKNIYLPKKDKMNEVNLVKRFLNKKLSRGAFVAGAFISLLLPFIMLQHKASSSENLLTKELELSIKPTEFVEISIPEVKYELPELHVVFQGNKVHMRQPDWVDVLRAPHMTDVECLATNMYFEARNQDSLTQKLTSVVVLNRVKFDIWSNDVCSVIREPRQFSWTHDGKSDVPTDMRAYKRAYLYALEVLYGDARELLDQYPDLVYFHSLRETPSGWGKWVDYRFTEGAFRFYTSVFV